MLKALLRKQLLEIRTNYFTGGRKKKKKKVGNPKGMYILFGFLYLVMMFGVFGLSMLLGDTLFPAGFDWMFFTIMAVMAFLLGIFGSVLSTANALFRSKDNEFLLSMPIPSWKIVFVRMIAVYITGLIYECLIMIPAIICHIAIGNASVVSVILSVLTIIVLGFLIAAFSCGIGWLVSLIGSKLKNQKIIRVGLIVILLGFVYYFQFNAQKIFTSIAAQAQEIAGNVSGWSYPLYAVGMGMSGNIIAFLVFTAITAVLFLAAYGAVSKSFAKIALTKFTEKKTAFRQSDIKTRSVFASLLKRELKRFLASVTYMLNGGLGIVLLIAGAVILLIKMQDLRYFLNMAEARFPGVENLLVVGAAQAVCILSSMVSIAASSISMEGKSIWLYKSMPLDPYRIFQAKIGLHVILTGVPALLCTLAAGYVLQTGFASLICMIIYVFMYIILTASFELTMDMKKPKLDWTNENQALKNNITVFATTFAALLLPIVIAAPYFLLQYIIGPEMYLVIFLAVFAVLTLLIHRWLAGKGRKKFAEL